MIKVDVSQVIGLEKALEALAGPMLDQNMKQGVFIAGAQVQSAAREIVPVDTGALRLSIENSPGEDSRGYLVTVGPSQPYGKEIEFGRPAGTQVDPVALIGWAKRKGLNPYAVARSIYNKGSPAQPFLFPAFDSKQDSIVAVIMQAMQNAIRQAFGTTS